MKKWLWVCLWILGLGLTIWLLWCVSHLLNRNLSDPVQFVTGNLLNALIFAAIVGQVYIYRKQWNAMTQGLAIESAKTDPRLRVSVHAEDFAPDKKPIFIVIINNDGLIAATNVAFEMVVKWLGREESLKDVFDVPAKDTEVQYLVSNGVLTDSQFKGFNESAPLIVEGILSYFPYQRKGGDPPQPFCYKYCPWKGDRPKGIPQFIRCSRTNIVNLGIPVPTGETITVIDENVRAKYGLGKTPTESKPEKPDPNH